MKKLLVSSLVLAAAAAAVTATRADAESLEEKKYWKKQMHYINRHLEGANEKCGVKFSFAWVDKPTFRAKAKEDGHSPYGICQVVIDETEMICRAGEEQKKAVKAKIKGFKCGYAKKRNLKLKKRSVRYMGNNVQTNTHTWAKDWLLKHL